VTTTDDVLQRSNHHHPHRNNGLPQQQDYEDQQLLPPKEVVRDSHQWHRIQTDVDVEKYRVRRSMTALQEKWNAVTVLPNPLFCLYFLWRAAWLVTTTTSAKEENVHAANEDPHFGYGQFAFYRNNHNNDIVDNDDDEAVTGWMGTLNNMLGDEQGCLPGYQQWHSMPALPPLPILAIALGICLHAPCSFLYHWRYAHSKGAQHWSRRLDQSGIHVCSALLSYAVSGHWNFFLANLVYNLDCCYRLFSPKHERPFRNQMRILLSVLAYTLPILHRGDVQLFAQLWAVFLVSGWFFAAYPVGGWSHTVFHLVIALVPPLLLQAAAELEASAPQIQLALFCRSQAAA